MDVRAPVEERSPGAGEQAPVAERSAGPGELVAGACGALLLAATFLPWYGLDAAIELPGRPEPITVRGESVSAWEAFGGIDVVLALAAAAAIALVAVRALGSSALAVQVALLVAAAGTICALLIVYRLVDPPELSNPAGTAGTETGRRLGAFFALIAAAGISWGGWRALAVETAPDETASRPARPARRPARPAPTSARPIPARARPTSRPARPAPTAAAELSARGPGEAGARPTPARSEVPEAPDRPVQVSPYDTQAGPLGEEPLGERAGAPPIRSRGVAAFEELVSELEPTLRRLWAAPFAPRAEHADIPRRPGVYLFTRRDAPVLVGQAPDLRKRLAEHCRPSSSHTKATLAFGIAKRAAARDGIDVDGPPARLATSDAFVPYFDRAKETVSGLPVRFIEVESPELRKLFEVYGALALGTTEPDGEEAEAP